MADALKRLLAFNRGVVSKLGLARMDLERVGMSAEIQKNVIPRVLGSAQFRPGTVYIDTMLEDLNLVRQIPFVFGVDDTALIECSGFLRIRIDDVVLTRPTVTAAITNPSFATDLSGWTVIAPGTTSVVWDSGSAVFTGDGSNFARLRQQVTVTGGEENIEHALEIFASNGMSLKVGSAAGLDDYIPTTIIGGQENIAFTPILGGSFWVELAWEKEYEGGCSQCDMSGAGEVQLISPWFGDNAISRLRWTQSGDIMYVASGPFTNSPGQNPRKIFRRFDGRSWGIQSYAPQDGPFRLQNTTPITMTASAIKGSGVTLTASEPYFDSLMGIGVGSLFRLASQGQVVTDTTSVAPVSDEFTDPIRVTGSEDAREFGIIVEGTFSATVTLQFAFSEDGPWNDQGQTFTAPISTNFKDGQDGQIIYYRIGVKVGDYTSGAVTYTLTYTGGSIEGICRVDTVTNSTTAIVDVLKDFGAITPTRDWWEGEWSNFRGYPSAVDIHESRMAWAGLDKLWLSITDQYESFDDNQIGDSGPISRTIGFGPIRVIHWLMSMGRLLFGTSDNSANVAAAKMDGNHPLGARSSSFDEPLTPTNFNIKTISSKGVFVDRTEQRLYELAWNPEQTDYQANDLTVLVPDYNEVGIRQIAVQMKPDIRVHCVRNDGTVGMLVFDRAENVIAWVEVEMGNYGTVVEQGWVEDVAVLPGKVEDQVYYTVQRNTGPSGLGEERYLEKFALESEAIGGTRNIIADSAVIYSGAPISTLTGLEHLQGFTVSVWADGADRGTGTVTIFGTPGELDLTALSGGDNAPYSDIVVGLPYTGQFKSARLGEIQGIGYLEHKRVNRIGFIARHMHYQGLQYGPDFNNLYDLPLVENSQVTADDFIWEDYHEENFGFGGEWDEDSRICLQMQSPRPVTLLAAIVEYESISKDSKRRR